MKIITGCLLPGMLSLSCKSAAQQKKETQPPAATTSTPGKKEVRSLPMPQQEKVASPGIAPGHCRIIGQVIAISPEPEVQATGICAQAPCRAKIKIKKIVGYGHSFNQILAVNQEVNAYFIFSLKPTAALLPKMTTPLPGLKIGNMFQADIALAAEVAGTSSVPWYQVALYQVQVE